MRLLLITLCLAIALLASACDSSANPASQAKGTDSSNLKTLQPFYDHLDDDLSTTFCNNTVGTRTEDIFNSPTTPQNTWPYGGMPESKRKRTWMKRKPLNFDKPANFDSLHFTSPAEFAGAVFADSATFNNVKFEQRADFRYAWFKGPLNCVDAEFFDVVDFEAAQFDVSAAFNHAVFHIKPNLDWTTLPRVVDFEHVEFKQELDLRLADFQYVDTIYLEAFNIETGKLLVDWDQLGRHNGKFRIHVREDSVYTELGPNSRDKFDRLQNIYFGIRNNFLAQDDGKSAADDVMYELALRQNDLLGGFWLTLYGAFFGYGYQPWRFLLYVVLPIILISSIFWYLAYYREIGPKVLEGFNELVADDVNTATTRRRRSRLTNTVWQTPDAAICAAVPTLARIWHVLFFSSSVLLGVKFSRDWLSVDNDKFNYWVTFQWLLGVGLYVSFAVLVKGSKFEFVKDLLGF